MSIDRRYGVVENQAIKNPCLVATTGTNIVLSGLQTIDGVVLTDSCRVLVKDQTDTTKNGVYLSHSAGWTRDLDFDGTLDIVRGTLVPVNSGSTNAGTLWQVTTADPIYIDGSAPSNITFALSDPSSKAIINAPLKNPPVDADQISIIDSVTNALARVTWANIKAAILLLFSVSGGAALIGFIQLGASAVARTAQDKAREISSAKDSGAAIDGVTDDTTVAQGRINDEAATYGRELLINSGAMITTGLTLPGTANQRVSIRGDSRSTIRAKVGATNAVLLQIAADISRSGWREIKNLMIDGNSVVGVTGIKTGSVTAATLQVYLRALDIRNCAVGLDLYTAMENSCTDVVAYLNTVGVKLRQDPTNGGANANRFDGLRLQQNTVGLMLEKTSAAPMGGDQFNQILVQSNSLCGIAMFNLNSGIQFNAGHFEGNGTAGGSSVIDGNTVMQCSVQMSASVASFRDCTFSESAANPCFLLQNGARLTLQDSGGYGLNSGLFISGSLSESVEFYGHHDALGMITAYVARWPDTISVASSFFCAIGEPTIQNTARISNNYSASSPSIPLLQNPVLATVNANTGDSEMGMVSSVTFAASAGNTSSNRITINALPSGVANGDTWAITFMVKASAGTLMNFLVTSGSYANFFNCPIDTKWRRVVMVFAAASANTPLIYCYPTNADAPTVLFSKMQALQIPSGGDTKKISETVSLGLFNNNQNDFYYTAAPTVGTWKQGDRIINSSPAAGVPRAWVCTIAGTPGTWVSEGAIFNSSAVAGLPGANAALAGERLQVTDATVTTLGTIVAGGGANIVPVYCDGTNWRIG